MKRTYKISRGDITFIVLFIFLMGFIAGTILAPERTIFRESPKQTVSVDGAKVVEMGLPAVDSEGNGVLGTLVTTIRPGSGQVLVNVNDVLAQFDTQFSGRIAAKVASNYTGIYLGNLDIVYDIRANATVIEGPSAGAAMTASIILALKNIESTNKIMMTGTIQEDGGVDKVGSILEKATVAKSVGVQIFLVPEGQALQTTATRIRSCRNYGRLEVCTVRYKYGETNIGESLNITVTEVKTIGDIIDVYQRQNEPKNVTQV